MRESAGHATTPHINLPHKGAELEISCGRARRDSSGRSASVWAQKLVPAAAHKGVNGLAKQQCGTKTSVSLWPLVRGVGGGAAISRDGLGGGLRGAFSIQEMISSVTLILRFVS